MPPLRRYFRFPIFFILIFQNGLPAYFYVSVRSTTQPSHISSSASCAGVAATAGEVATDAKHLAMVEKVGGDFISLWRYVLDPKMEGNCGPIFIHFWKLFTHMIFQSKSG